MNRVKSPNGLMQNALSALIDTNRMKAASFKMVLTAVGDYAYRRPTMAYSYAR